MESARSYKAQPLSGLPAANNMATNDTSRASSADFEDCDISDVENDTSSDGGSTVREINAQLEDSNTEWKKLVVKNEYDKSLIKIVLLHSLNQSEVARTHKYSSTLKVQNLA